jgi:GntR family transcriptional regulator
VDRRSSTVARQDGPGAPLNSDGSRTSVAGTKATRKVPAIPPKTDKTATEGKEPRGTFGYRQIAATLIDEIHRGNWTLNERLPSEMDLVERFGVGRNTVREALRELQDLGYLSRRRGTRSVLIRTTPESSFVNSVRSVDELLEYANTTRTTLLASENVILSPERARQLDCPAGSEWLRIQLLRRREAVGLPFCYSEVYIHPKYQDVLPHVDGEHNIYSIIERRHNIVIRRVVQEIEAASADENIASRLHVPSGSPILLARTKFFASDTELVEVGMAHFATGRYRVRIALDRKARSD